jgi:hypothetical protein
MSSETVARVLRDVGIVAQKKGNQLHEQLKHLDPAGRPAVETRMWALWDLAAVLTEGTQSWLPRDG